MRTLIVFLFVLFTSKSFSQVTPNKDTAVSILGDTTLSEEIKENVSENIPVVSLDESENTDATAQDVSGQISTGRDPFHDAAAFHFSSVRFRIRGYDADFFTTYLNGAPMESLDNGFTPFGLWGGLNDVMRNRQSSYGLRPGKYSVGNIGASTSIDARASKQRRGTRLSYALSNGNYTHRFMATYNSGLTKDGWAVTLSGSRRWADEGYVAGTYYDGWSFFVGVDKKLGKKNLLSFSFFGAPTENGRQGSSTQEAMDLAGSHYYNPSWGYQEGKKRNANVGKTNEPVLLLNHELNISKKTTLTTAVSYTFGERSTSALDWYNAADPRPDYYRYLPSYYDDYPNEKAALSSAIAANPNLLQIDWQHLYSVNRNSIETVHNAYDEGRTFTGRRSRYIIQERVTKLNRATANTTLSTKFGKHVDFNSGAFFEAQKNNSFNRVADLLGGDFFLDVNQFAERDFPNNDAAVQGDLNRPNRILIVDSKYGNDYDIYINHFGAFADGTFKFRHFDVFLAAEGSRTEFWRHGNVRNGVFPNNSFGNSPVNTFNNYTLKGGASYKLNNRNFLYANVAYMTKAPFYQNVYLSPRTRNDIQDNAVSELVKSAEAGYVLSTPLLKARLTGYYTTFEHEMKVYTFYHDDLKTFVNYALNGIDKVHFGSELGIEARIVKNVTLSAAASVGRYYYDSRPTATITYDNGDRYVGGVRVVDPGKETIYLQNYRLAASPQEAYNAGLTYRSRKFWSVSVSASYFDQTWLDPNPIRRTERAVDAIDLSKPDDVAKFHAIIDQTELEKQFTMDLFANKSWKLGRKVRTFGRTTFIGVSASVNNLLDNTNIVTGGFEQLRYDATTGQADKFPPKVYYGYGRTYNLSVNYRF